MNLAEIKLHLERAGLSPRKALGQNFLIDQNLARKLVESSGVGPGDLVLEVGPGTGALTEVILESGAHVIACELDSGLASVLRDRWGDEARFELIEGDCLERKSALSDALAHRLGDHAFTLVANLPYGCATPLMMTLMTRWPGCLGQFVTIQLEVAERLRAGPRDAKAYGAISVVAQALCEPELIAKLPRECFWPRPDVTSAMLALRRRSDPLEPDPARWPAFAAAASAVFAQRRKQLGATLRRLNATDVALPPGVEPTHRPEQVSIEALAHLCRALSSADGVINTG